MAVRDFNTPLQDTGEAVNRIYRLAAIAQAGAALMNNKQDLVETFEEFQSTVFLLEKIEDDLRQLAFCLEELEVKSIHSSECVESMTG
jgi:hypothetical protein